jgi:hypothetical protein
MCTRTGLSQTHQSGPSTPWRLRLREGKFVGEREKKRRRSHQRVCLKHHEMVHLSQGNISLPSRSQTDPQEPSCVHTEKQQQQQQHRKPKEENKGEKQQRKQITLPFRSHKIPSKQAKMTANRRRTKNISATNSKITWLLGEGLLRDESRARIASFGRRVMCNPWNRGRQPLGWARRRGLFQPDRALAGRGAGWMVRGWAEATYS